MPREINAAGYTLVKEFEGLRLRAYLCPAGVWTIGYGHTDGVIEGLQISEMEADRFLDSDLDWAEACVDAIAKNANSNEFAAMVSLTFNIGAEGFRKSTVLRLHNAGDKAGAARAFRMWNKATVGGKLVELAGLTRRRLAEEALYLTPATPAFQEQAMAQEVAPEKPVTASKTVITGAVGTVAAAGAVADQVKPAVDAITQATDAFTSATTGLGAVKAFALSLVEGRGLAVVLTAVALGCVVFVVGRYILKKRRGELVSW